MKFRFVIQKGMILGIYFVLSYFFLQTLCIAQTEAWRVKIGPQPLYFHPEVDSSGDDHDPSNDDEFDDDSTDVDTDDDDEYEDDEDGDNDDESDYDEPDEDFHDASSDDKQYEQSIQFLNDTTIICTSAESLFAISTSGNKLWSVYLDYENGKNCFIDSLDDIYIVRDDSTDCFDADGEKQFTVSGKGKEVDDDGNLYAFEGNTLKKISRTGTQLWQTGIATTGKVPVRVGIDGANNVYAVSQFINVEIDDIEHAKKSNGIAIKKLNENGTVIASSEKKLGNFSRKGTTVTGDRKGEDFKFEFFFTDSTGNSGFFGDGTYNQKKGGMSRKAVNTVDWGIASFSPSLKTKYKKYKGKGKEEAKFTANAVKHNNLNSYNAINSAHMSSNGAVIVGGVFDERKFKNNVRVSGAYYPTIMKFNLKKGKPDWTKEIKMNSYDAVRQIELDENDNIHLTLNDGKKMRVYDESGNNSDSLEFDDSLETYIFDKNHNMYAIVDSYLVKYTVPTPKFSFGSVTNIETEYVLSQNYPNPFNPQTAIGFSLLAVGNVTLKIYNVLGQEVATLLSNEMMEEGMHEVQFDASGLTSGVYFYRITATNETQNFSQVKKMLLMK